MRFTGERVVPSDMHRNVDTYQQHLLRYVWALNHVANKEVLDAACGTGYGSHLMSDVAKHVTGFDVSVEAIEYARSRNFNASFHQMDLDNPKEGLAERDVVVTFETIEHLKDPQKFLDWCKQTAPVVIGSIPLNCPTEYHLHNYTCEQAIGFILKQNFKSVELWHQMDMELHSIQEFKDTSHGMILFVGRR